MNANVLRMLQEYKFGGMNDLNKKVVLETRENTNALYEKIWQNILRVYDENSELEDIAVAFKYYSVEGLLGDKNATSVIGIARLGDYYSFNECSKAETIAVVTFDSDFVYKPVFEGDLLLNLLDTEGMGIYIDDENCWYTCKISRYDLEKTLDKAITLSRKYDD